jgi:hypothetical protein
LRRILHALQDRHGLTLRGLAELEVNLFREPEDEAFARGMPDVPLALPEHAPLGSAFPFFLFAPVRDHD